MINIVIDLDNTVAIYDHLILEICNDMKVDIPAACKSKLSISNYLKSIYRNDLWTEIQGICYGPKMQHAKVATGFRKCAEFLKKSNCRVILVSHKTQFPASGLEVDLRLAARSWIDQNLYGVFDAIYFENTLISKVSRIKKIDPRLLVDDLESVLLKSELGKDRSVLIHNSEIECQSQYYQTIKTWDLIRQNFNL
jgi:hypothetical protein